MPKEKLPMRKVREVLRLKWGCGLSSRAVAQSCGIARSTVAEYLRRAERAELSWPLPEGLDEEKLDSLLFPVLEPVAAQERFLPDWAEVHRELKRKGVTLSLLWQEYKEAHPEGYQYSFFCEHYRRWQGALDVCMRQDHKAGEKMFVDYAGHTMPLTDRKTGEVREAQVFVAVLGASNYTYVEATEGQTLPDWIGSHVRALMFFRGAPAIFVPDNLRSGVSKAHWYEPEVNRSYEECARHFGAAVVPARVRRPQDKALAELGVQGIERQLLARLRNHTFFSLAELNRALWRLLEEYNQRPFQKLQGSRKSLFETLEQPALRPLPPQAYEYGEWKKARVNVDYHIAVDGHFYSVPYQLVKEQVDVRITATTVEVFHKHKRIASHFRGHHKNGYSTVKEHMPETHRQYAEWTPERLVRWAEKAGGQTAALIEAILAGRLHPQQGFRACLGIMRLGKLYGQDRLEAACARALAIQAPNFKSVESILKKGLDRQPLPKAEPEQPVIEHDNIRGPEYYG